MWSKQSSTEYFKELVENAIEHQGVTASEMVRFYIVNLLASCVESENLYKHDEPLAITFTRATQASFAEQVIIFRHVGDFSLYISGFFSESLTRKLVDVDYYISIGRMAYGYLAELGMLGRCNPFHKVHQELSRKFVTFTDILTEVSERCKLTSSENILRLYEKWLKTGSELTAKMLRDIGIEPVNNLHCKSIH